MKTKLITAVAVSIGLATVPIQAGILDDAVNSIRDKAKSLFNDGKGYVKTGWEYTKTGANYVVAGQDFVVDNAPKAWEFAKAGSAIKDRWIEEFIKRHLLPGDGKSTLPDLSQWKFRAMALQRELDKDVPLSQATFLMTHNSYNAKDYADAVRYSDPNQHYNIAKQLMVGTRSLEFDLHYTNKRIRLCHGKPSQPVNCDHYGFSDRYFTQGLEEVADWFRLPSSRDQVVLIYLEDHISGSDYQTAVSEIESRIGPLVYRPQHGGTQCEGIPMNITKQDILNSGKNIVLMGGGDACEASQAWKSWVFKGVGDRNGYPTGDAGKKLHVGGHCAANESFTRDFYNRYLVRFHEDRNILTKADKNSKGEPLEYINDTDVVEILKCGGNLIGLDHLGYRGGDRFKAMVWSWAENEPNNQHGAEDCAMSNTDGRFNDYTCYSNRHFACLNTTTNAWAISQQSGSWEQGPQACAAMGSGFEFSVPFNSYENEKLKQAKQHANKSEVWLNYSDRQLEGVWQKASNKKLVKGEWVNTTEAARYRLAPPSVKLTLQNPSYVVLDLKAPETDARLTIKNQNRHVIATQDHGGVNNDARYAGNLPAGTYYLELSSTSGWGKGSYELSTNSGHLEFERGLIVESTGSYHWVYNDAGSGADSSVSIWRANVPSGFKPIGDVAVNGHQGPNYRTLIVKDEPGVVAAPIDYVKKWDDEHSDGDHDGSFWNPVPPPGYTCLGAVGRRAWDKPSLDLIRCVRSEFVVTGAAARIWTDSGSGSKVKDGSAWLPFSNNTAGVNAGVFMAGDGHGSGPTSNFKVLNRFYIKEKPITYQEYRFKNSHCLDIASNQAVGGADIRLDTCKGTDDQKWFLDEGLMRSKLNPSMCLDITGAHMSNGTNIQLHPCTGHDAQQFKYVDDFLLASKNESFAITVNNGEAQDGKEVFLWERNGPSTPHQKWDTKQYYRIANQNQCLDVTRWQTGDGTNVQAWECQANNPAQLFWFDGPRIRSKLDNNKCLDAFDVKSDNGTNVILWGCHNNLNQKWWVNGNSIGTYLSTNSVLDIQNNQRENGTNIQLWENHYNPTQTFRLVK